MLFSVVMGDTVDSSPDIVRQLMACVAVKEPTLEPLFGYSCFIHTFSQKCLPLVERGMSIGMGIHRSNLYIRHQLRHKRRF